jgi:glycosyltransferase involved in cell wall biosynthesis
MFAQVDADIVHARSRLPAWLASFALRGMRGARKPRFVTTVHGLNSPSRYSAVMASGERVICVSRTVRNHVLQHYPQVDPAALQVIERGIDPAAFPRADHPDTAARSAVASLHPQLSGSGPLLLLPGRGTRLKGHHDALCMLATLRASGVDARLWMPGARQSGRADYVAELERDAAALNLTDAVAISAPTAAMAQAYAASTVVLQLSRKPEAFGRTVLEALSVGRPVIGWAHGGVGELLARWLPQGAVAPFDVDALAAATRALLASPPPLPVTMPDGLRAMQQATLALYEQLA